jgi:hypothetical protein
MLSYSFFILAFFTTIAFALSKSDPDPELLQKNSVEKTDLLAAVWLNENQDAIYEFDSITGKLVKVREEEETPGKKNEQLHKLAQLHPKSLQKSKKSDIKNKSVDYDHEFVRLKMFPMAAVAYEDEATIKACLDNTFKNATLYRDIEILCGGHKNQLCSAFTAVNHDDKAIVIAFRGTVSFFQLIIEAYDIVMESKYESPVGGHIGSYFMKTFLDLFEAGLMKDMLFLTSEFPDYEVWITGHSLGGALASVAASFTVKKLNIPAEKVKLMTIGQPRTGDRDWAIAMDDILPFNYRIVHDRDVIAHVPPINFEGYYHYTAEVWYPNDMENNAEYSVCNDYDEDTTHCSGQRYRYKINDHYFYFNENLSKFSQNGCLWKH